MSTPRYNWWSFALHMIRDYPARQAKLHDLRTQQITASTSGGGHGGGNHRTTEAVALRELPPQEQKEYNAVARAMEIQRTLPRADLRKKVVRLTLIRRSHTLEGAAAYLGITREEAKQYRWEFIMMVGYAWGFLSEEELSQNLQKKAYRSTGKSCASKAKKM